MSINNRAYTNKFSRRKKRAADLDGYHLREMIKRNSYLGKWRIIEMEMWDQDFIDMETEGHFTFEKDEIEYFQRAVRLR